MFTGSTLNAGVIAGTVQQKLKAHRAALNDLNDLYAWSSGISAADLEGAGFTAADAQELLSALNDAHAEYVLHNTGQPPAAYPQAASSYMYAASQNQVIGPS
jgi:hypothetical protein